jgi:hypothetical protein
MCWQPTNIGSELRESFYAIRTFAMAVGIDDDETGTAELNAGDGYWKLLPPQADLNFIGGGGFLPPFDKR